MARDVLRDVTEGIRGFWPCKQLELCTYNTRNIDFVLISVTVWFSVLFIDRSILDSFQVFGSGQET